MVLVIVVIFHGLELLRENGRPTVTDGDGLLNDVDDVYIFTIHYVYERSRLADIITTFTILHLYSSDMRFDSNLSEVSHVLTASYHRSVLE